MPNIRYRANISTDTFPLVAENFGRTVIVRGQDQNYIPYITSQEEMGIPQGYYMHNVLPVVEGFQSIGYNKFISGVSPGETQFDEVFILRDVNENKAYFTHTKDGRNFISLYPYYNWINTTYIAAAASPNTVTTTVAHINGASYIYFSGVGCYYYDFATNSLVPVVLSSLDPTVILGIVASNGYLIAFNADGVFAWSSTISVTDFTPDSITGAGSGRIQEVAGKVVTAVSSQYGFIVVTTNNAVEATYSRNSAEPFNFNEIASSGGIAGKDLISYHANSTELYTYTTKGIQVIKGNQASTVFPEVTDFIAGAYFEDFDEQTLKFTRTVLSSTMKKRLNFISDRYLVISYGITDLTHAIVVDTVQKSIGKLKIDHVQCFQWSVLSPEVIETPKKSIAFLQKDGTVQVVDFDVADEYTNGILVLGKFQYIRQDFLHVHTMSLSSIRVKTNFYAYHIGEIDGKEDVAPTELPLISDVNTTRTYGVDKIARNHSLILKGAFFLSEFELELTTAGVM